MSPYERPGERFYATATKAVNHGAPVIEGGVPGVAIKQQPYSYGAGLGATEIIQVAISEKFVIDAHGVVQVPSTGISSPAKGDLVYITASTNALTKTASGNVPYGRIYELAGERGCPTGFVRINLDDKV